MEGETFGRLTVIRVDGRWCDCKCSCGTVKKINAWAVRSGNTKSCGCYQKEHPARLVHGHARTSQYSPEYYAWASAKKRCLNPNDVRYPSYGARGIRMCDEWLNDFQTFLAYIGPRPSDDHSLDRIDTHGDYEPGNVRWASRVEQMNNTTQNIWFEHCGRKMTLAQVAKAERVPYHWLYRRVVTNGRPLAHVLHERGDTLSKITH